MVHQELNQALTRSVQDNLWLGRYPKVGGIMVSEKIMAKRTQEIFDKLEVTVDPKTIMATMPVSQRQMVEIAKAVSYDAKIIVFDEPHLLPDGDRGGAPLPHHQYAAGTMGAALFTYHTRWKKSSASATMSPSLWDST